METVARSIQRSFAYRSYILFAEIQKVFENCKIEWRFVVEEKASVKFWPRAWSP